MKRVALLTDGWKRTLTYAWTDGIMNRIAWADEEICLYQFQSFGNWSKDLLFNIGEYNIYNLPNLDQYDGIIIHCNNIVESQHMEKIVQRLRAASATGVPVICIGQKIEGFYYVGIDNHDPIRQIVSHLYEKHGCRSFVWAGGPASNYENQQREEAFASCMREYNIPDSDVTYLSGDYDFATGERYLREYVNLGKAFPDVFVCANDNIAAGLCAQAEKNGYRVPEDFRVTGFDNLEKALYFRPQIATVSQDRGQIGAKAMDMLIRLWAGESVPTFEYLPTTFITGESCGCENNGLVNYREYVRNHILYSVDSEIYDGRVGELGDDMAASGSFEDIFDVINHFFMELDCDGSYIVINKRLLEAGRAEEFSIEGYNLSNLVVAAAMENGIKLEFADTVEFLNYIDTNGAGQAYMITPIHFRQYTVGVLVVKNSRFLYSNPFYYDINATFSTKLESMFKQTQLEGAMEKLKVVYDHDRLTGLYNRVAYEETILPLFEEYKASGKRCAIVFLDVDNFKIINDTKGHKYGDELLIKIARVLLKCEPDGGYTYRFGGDEFVLFYPDSNAQKLDALMEKLNTELAKINVESSVGIIETDPASDKTLDDYLVMADQKMYERKRRVHSADASD